ncbi:MAG: glycosyltransferase family 39 protein [Flavobacteriales bacterium]|nr:glycosyltransferase family 39 protein [Flavobacteriales bacterium]
MSWNRTSISILIAVITLGLILPFIGMSHLFDWDEVNFAEAAREMLVTGEFTYVQINFKPFWEKPPLFIWMQALSMSAFGITEFAARFPNAICGALTLVILFNIGSNLVSKKFGILWVLVFAGSMLPQFYFRTGIIDPWFNLFIFTGIHLIIKSTRNQALSRRELILSAVVISLAVMTKGPTAIGLVGICCAAYFLINFRKHNWRLGDPFLYTSLVLILGFSWFLLEILRGHAYVVYEFIDYHVRLFSKSEAGHGQPFFYHPLVLLVGCFPMSLFLIFRWFNKIDEKEEVAHYAKWMAILFWVVLVVFSIVKTKIVHYSSLTYFPMSFMAALTIHHLIEGKWKFRPVHQIALMMFIALLGSAFTLAGMLDTLKEPLLNLLKNDALAYGNFSQHVPDLWFEPFIGFSFMVFGMGSVFLITIGRSEKGVYGLFGTTLITVWLLSVFIAPKIDKYTQTSLFDFYREKGSAVYFHPLAYRSYAHLFYPKRQQIPQEVDDELKWMILDKVDKPVYFVSRLQDLETTMGFFPQLKEIERKGGYVILERTDEGYPFLGER